MFSWLCFPFPQHILKTYCNLEYSNISVVSKPEVKKPKPISFFCQAAGPKAPT